MHFGCVSAEGFSLTQNNGQPTETANQLIVALLLNFSSLWQKLKNKLHYGLEIYRPQAARTSQLHVFELGPKKFEMNKFM